MSGRMIQGGGLVFLRSWGVQALSVQPLPEMYVQVSLFGQLCQPFPCQGEPEQKEVQLGI